MRPAIAVALTVGLICAGAGNADAANVLLLGDADAELQIQPALESAGNSVVFGGVYYEWDGVDPDVTDFDVVVYLDGYDYGYGLQPAAEAALAEFVGQGGGLIVTEWIMYDTSSDLIGPELLQLMPVTYNDDYTTEATWTVLDAGHPLAAGLPASWSDTAQYSHVVADPNATVVIENENGNPMVTYRVDSGGVVLHINHDMTYTTETINANCMQILVNAGGVCGILRRRR